MVINFKYWNTRVVRYSLLALSGSTAAITTGITQSLTASDWGTWVGAVGTVGTLIGAIWIASDQSRKNHHEAREAAIVASSFLQIRVRGALGLVSNALEDLAQHETRTTFNFADFSAKLERFGIWKKEELFRIAILPNNAAAHLAFASTLLDSIIIWSNNLHNMRRNNIVDEGVVELMHQALVDAKMNLKPGLDEINRIIEI